MPAHISVEELVTRIRVGRFSATAVVEDCLSRIESLNGTVSHEGGPDDINAWVRVLTEHSLARAAEIDAGARGTAGSPGRSLLGVPIGLKDVISIGGVAATASSRRVPVRDAERSSEVWQRLARAGAIALGHTHTHEFAVGPTTDQCANPWDKRRTAGGSSGGSAAAVAAAMMPAALGTDAAGSIRIPAALCGITGFKPSRGWLPNTGVIPLGASFDHVGPMALTAADCALLFDACAGVSAQLRPLVERHGPTPLAGTRIAVIGRSHRADLHPDVDNGLSQTRDALREQGAIVSEIDPPALPREVAEEQNSLLMTDISRFHSWLGPHPAAYQADVAELLTRAAETALSDDRYTAIQAQRSARSAAWDDWFRRYQIDAILEPTCPIPAPLRGRPGDSHPDRYTLAAFTPLWNYLGNPVVALPSGLGPESGMPIGMSLISRHHHDRHLLQLAIDLQHVLPAPRLEP